jgi:hypothetical protein
MTVRVDANLRGLRGRAGIEVDHDAVDQGIVGPQLLGRGGVELEVAWGTEAIGGGADDGKRAAELGHVATRIAIAIAGVAVTITRIAVAVTGVTVAIADGLTICVRFGARVVRAGGYAQQHHARQDGQGKRQSAGRHRRRA